jgi:deoxyribodipyrimidine photo-lyase
MSVEKLSSTQAPSVKKFNLSLFIFRRDLRLTDNTALIAALKASKEVIPCFIFDPRQIKDNDFKSDHCIQFMLESLDDLKAQLNKKKAKLYIFQGPAETVVAKLLKATTIDAVFCNKDYTPFSKARDTAIAQVCKQHKISFHSYDDALLNPPSTVLKTDKTPYVVFTPFFNNARQIKVAAPEPNSLSNYYTKPLTGEKTLTVPKSNLPQKGGRTHGLALLKKLNTLQTYAKDRDYPFLDATSHLSPHLKFTTCSVREVFHAAREELGASHPVIRQLYWRDFFTTILDRFPAVLGHPFHAQFSKLPWDNNKALFKHWCEGSTGFPIIDAGMRELNATGLMHNRVRLLVASFLVKDLHINWQWGERYFAQKLLDYDPAVNNGNWQWVASTGCDAQPYFRIFNPWLQQKKFDAHAEYIKTWVPELKHVAAQDIHNWHKLSVRQKYKTPYPASLVDHTKEAAYAKKVYGALRKKP